MINDPAPSRLAIFVTDPDSGVPVVRLPLFAEVVMPRPTRTHDARNWIEALTGALNAVDRGLRQPAYGSAQQAVIQAIGRELAEGDADALARDYDRATEFAVAILREMLEDAGAATFADVPPSRLTDLARAAVRRVADRRQIPLRTEDSETVLWSDPLGVLTTDHAGYASFDLRRLRPEAQVALAAAVANRRMDPDSAAAHVRVRVHPYGSAETWDVLAQARFAMDAIVGRFTASWHTLPPAMINMGPRALQDPSLTDWRLSPASFAASPLSLVGEDGTEELIPSNLALQEFVLRQVVRLNDAAAPWELPPDTYAAYVDDYKVTWSALGHSLGEIQYSLPLAPGETVRLAMIDWSYSQSATRAEETVFTEDLLHETHRDRTISETVRAALREYQHGSSFMGGAAGSAGASGGANLGVVGLGAAVGNAWSLGGSTATSEGSRDLAAENVQRLNDSFAQASSTMRELTSTVVVQAQENQKQTIQTRTFTNYNHGHTMTVLYYEVLRHYRVSVEWIRRRRAILLRGTKIAAAIGAEDLVARRHIVEPNLLDPSFAAAFDAAGRRALGEAKLARAVTVWEGTAITDDPGLKVFVKLLAQFTTGDADDSSEPVFVTLTLNDARSFEFTFDDAAVSEGTSPEMEKNLPVPILWRDLKEARLTLKDVNDGSDWRVTNVLLTMVTSAGERVGVVAWSGSRKLDDEGGTLGPLTAATPPKATVTYPTPRPSRSDFVTAEDDLIAEGLVTHVRKNPHHYDRLFSLAAHVDQIATTFEALPWPGGSHVIDHVVPTALETFGSYVAYPLVDQGPGDDARVTELAAALGGSDPARRAWATEQLAGLDEEQRAEVLSRVALASSRSERLASMPTRGVFAEGKLGHGNVAEEIDNTRFWKWEEHPIPIQAPEIAPATPITPEPQGGAPTTPTGFPQSLVNVVNPSPAPDPGGLGAALGVLATANIFRDMSGQQQVADLLETLSDNSVKIAEVAVQAQKAATGAGSPTTEVPADEGGGTQTGRGVAPSDGATPKQSPPTPPPDDSAERESERIDNGVKKLKAATDHLPPKQQAKVREQVIEQDWARGKKWTVSLNSEWQGAQITKKPMKASYVGEVFLAGHESKLLNPTPYATDQFSKWEDITLEGEPIGLSLIANEIEPFTDTFTVNIPGLTIDGFALKEKTYQLPLRSVANNFPSELKANVDDLKIPAGSTLIRLRGVAEVAMKSIEVTLQFTESGELTGELGRELTASAELEKLLSLGMSITMKGGVKVAAGAQQGIKGTFDVLYLVGWKVTQIT